MESISFGGKKIIQSIVPGWESWVPRLLDEILANRDNMEHSHKIMGRWENSYLPIDRVPTARKPMRYARDLGKDELKISSAILFEPLPFSKKTHPPFWFNLGPPGAQTGVHDHVSLSVLSAVTYLSCEENSGNLFFVSEGEEDLEIRPEVGKLLLFDPSMKHGVRENCSGSERVSFAFNLFPFPLPAEFL